MEKWFLICNTLSGIFFIFHLGYALYQQMICSGKQYACALDTVTWLNCSVCVELKVKDAHTGNWKETSKNLRVKINQSIKMTSESKYRIKCSTKHIYIYMVDPISSPNYTDQRENWKPSKESPSDNRSQSNPIMFHPIYCSFLLCVCVCLHTWPHSLDKEDSTSISIDIPIIWGQCHMQKWLSWSISPLRQ